MEKIIIKICNYLNNEPNGKLIVEELRKYAIMKKLSAEEWKKLKEDFVIMIFLKLVNEHKDLQEIISSELLENFESGEKS